MRFGVPNFQHLVPLFLIRQGKRISFLGRFSNGSSRGYSKASGSMISETQNDYELRCRECSKSWGNQPRSICDDCFSPLEVFYDYEAARPTFTRERIAQGPASMWRYSALLPLPRIIGPRFPPGLPHCSRRRAWLKSWERKTSILKNDAVCQPSLSFKDRVVAVALAQARSLDSIPSPARPREIWRIRLRRKRRATDSKR